MNKTIKLWGVTSEIFTNDSVSIHRIEIIKEQKCSKHFHEYKYNMFFVETGKIIVHRWEEDTIISSVLKEEESLVISPRVWHQFEAIEDSIVYEIYYTKLENNDIIRIDNT
jgi:quercetin dioxygenase-like cupin family protein